MLTSALGIFYIPGFAVDFPRIHKDVWVKRYFDPFDTGLRHALHAHNSQENSNIGLISHLPGSMIRRVSYSTKVILNIFFFTV